MKTFKITVARKRTDGYIMGRALYRVEAETKEQAMEKIKKHLVSEPEEEIIEVVEA